MKEVRQAVIQIHRRKELESDSDSDRNGNNITKSNSLSPSDSDKSLRKRETLISFITNNTKRNSSLV